MRGNIARLEIATDRGNLHKSFHKIPLSAVSISCFFIPLSLPPSFFPIRKLVA